MSTITSGMWSGVRAGPTYYVASNAGPTRSSMTTLIARLRVMLNSDATFANADLQTLLDDHAIAVDALLEPRAPFYTKHLAPFENLETDAIIYYGYNTALTENSDYTADYQRGLFTTPAAEYRGLKILGMAYDLNAAAADGWEQIAARSADAFAWSDVEGSYHPEQARQFALDMAKAHRRKAWATSRTVERADTPVGPSDWREQVVRRARAGYGPS